MSKIELGKELKMTNVLSLRKKMTQQDMQSEVVQIGETLKQLDVKKSGCVVTTVFAMEGELLDVEILMPLEKEVQLPSEYTLKKEFKLVNAVYARFEGNPNLLNNHLQQMMMYIAENKLQQITGAYNVQITEDGDINNMIIDTYIGVSGNIL